MLITSTIHSLEEIRDKEGKISDLVDNIDVILKKIFEEKDTSLGEL
jgi:hypothetical protein